MTVRRRSAWVLALGLLPGCGDDAASVGETGGTGGTTTTTTTGTTDPTTSGSETGVAPTGECGNGVLELGEDCDDGQNGDNDDGCTDACNVPRCGDGFAQPSLLEECDVGDAAPDAECSATCDALQGPLWTRMVTSPGQAFDVGEAVAIDGTGNVVVVGTLDGPAGTDIWIGKYDPAGTELWTRTHSGMAVVSADFGESVAIGPGDAIVVAGAQSVTGQQSDIWVRQYDAGGTEQWTVTVDGPGSGADSALGVAAAGDGTVAVAGYVEDMSFARTIWYGKYDGGGNEQWTREVAGATNELDQAFDVDIDDAGNIVVAGTLSDEVWIRKTDGAGAEVWTEVFDGIPEGLDAARDVRFDAAGDVLVLGSTDHLYVRKFASAGGEVWTMLYAGSEALGRGLGLDAAGNLYIAGAERVVESGFVGTVQKSDPDGNVLWKQRIEDATVVAVANAVATGPDGTLVAVGWERAGLMGDNLWVRKFGPS